MTPELIAAMFAIDVGSDEKTGDPVAAVVRDDGLFLNLELVDAMIEFARIHPTAFEHLTNAIYSLSDLWEQRGKA